MSRAELIRHMVSAFLTIVILSIELSLRATRFDSTEIAVLFDMTVYAALWVFIMWVLARDRGEKKGRVSLASVAFALCVAVVSLRLALPPHIDEVCTHGDFNVHERAFLGAFP